MNFAELEFETLGEHVTVVEDSLFALGATSVGLFDAGDEPLLEPPPGSHPLWQAIRVRAHFPDRLEAEIAAAALQSPPGRIRNPSIRTVENEDWVRAGLAGLTRIHAGRRLWVVPSWEPLPDIEDGVFVHLDPGLAFGTGNHPTTAMCLRALADSPPAGATVLDYGCGSGILAISALKLGAAQALAVDIDPQALLATRDNAGRNGIGPESLSTALPEDPPAESSFDLVVANILSGPLIELAPVLARSARPGAALLLAGLLDRQADEVMAAYRDSFDVAVADREDGWVLLRGCRR